MKFLFSFILVFSFLVSFAKKPEHLSISAGKNQRMELKYRSACRKSTAAVITITDASGKIISTQTSELVFGNNSISLSETADLSEGSYNVQMVSGKKTLKSQFIVWR